MKNIYNFDKFELESDSIWSFPDRGNWATHKGDYRGNCSPYVVRNILLRYSKKGDIVLDQFLGSGTTMIEAKILERKGIGVDINNYPLSIAKERLKFGDNSESIKLYRGDARKLNFINNSSIDLIFTHPPYSNIIKYSKNIEGDLSLVNYSEFVNDINEVASESFRVLKRNKFCCVLIGDIRVDGYIKPLGFELMNVFLDKGFLLKEIIVKEQHNTKMYDYWKEKSIKYNFLLIAHEYIFVFKK